jgi:hypothetical protein
MFSVIVVLDKNKNNSHVPSERGCVLAQPSHSYLLELNSREMHHSGQDHEDIFYRDTSLSVRENHHKIE